MANDAAVASEEETSPVSVTLFPTTHHSVTPSDALMLDAQLAMRHTIAAAVHLSSAEFIKGFLVGQVALLLLLLALARFFLFRGSVETKQEARRLQEQVELQRVVSSSQVTASPMVPGRRVSTLPLSDYDFAEKALFDILSPLHQPSPLMRTAVDTALSEIQETMHWFNFLLSQILDRYRHSPLFRQRLLSKLHEHLNGPQRPFFISPIAVTDCQWGDTGPLFHDAKIVRCGDGVETKLRLEIGFTWRDQISLSLETQLLVHWPRQDTASLPVALKLEMTCLSGTMALELVTTESRQVFLAMTVLNDVQVDSQIHSLLGHRTKIKDLPKLTQWVTVKLSQFLRDRIVSPNYVDIALPGLREDVESERVDDETTLMTPSVMRQRH